MANSCFFAHHGDLSVAMCCARMQPFSGTHSSPRRPQNWDPYGRPQNHRVAGLFGFPRAVKNCWLAGAAPVKTSLTIDENESKVNDYFQHCGRLCFRRNRQGRHRPHERSGSRIRNRVRTPADLHFALARQPPALTLVLTI